jgi:phytoene synthase
MNAGLDAAFEQCERLVREADKDRFLATLFAPAQFRPALFALYAFNAEVARVRDAAREPIGGEIRLQWWAEALGGERRDEAIANPVAAALLGTIARHGLPTQRLLDLIEARSFDLYDDPMPSLVHLEAYAEKTTSVLFDMAAQILDGAKLAGEIAQHAGKAYATAGLLRALPRHASRRQLYIPLDILQRHGAEPEDVFAGKATPGLRAALAELRLHARGHLAAVRDLLPAAPEAALPALLPIAVVRPLLSSMEKRGYEPFTPVDIPQWRRQWILWRAARRPPRMAR